MKTNKTFNEEFKTMFFDYKIIYVFIAYIIISILSSFLIGYKPVKTVYTDTNIDYSDDIEKLKENYYGMKYIDIEKDINKKIAEIRGYEDSSLNDSFTKYYELLVKKSFLLDESGVNQEKINELDKKIEIAKKEFDDVINKISSDLPKEDQDKVNKLTIVSDVVRYQTEDNNSDTFYDIRKEGLLLGIGNYFNKNFHFIAWVNALVLEIFLGLISYLYVRKRKEDIINKDDSSYILNKRNILLSFITISILMAILMFIKHLLIVNMNHPGEIKNLYLNTLLTTNTNYKLYSQLIITVILSIIYYTLRPIIYAKRVEIHDVKKSSIYFIVFNLLMYVIYFNLNVGGFVSLTGPGFLSGLFGNIISLILFIIISLSSYRSYKLGRGFFERRKIGKFSKDNIDNNINKTKKDIDSIDEVK